MERVLRGSWAKNILRKNKKSHPVQNYVLNILFDFCFFVARLKTTTTVLQTSAHTDPPPRRRRAHSANTPGCPRGRWIDFDDDDRDNSPSKPKSPKKITVLPMSMRPRRRSSSTNAVQWDSSPRCGCDCHHNVHLVHDTWPVTRNRSDTT